MVATNHTEVLDAQEGGLHGDSSVGEGGRSVYRRDIAAQVGVHPKTVSRTLKRGAAPTDTRRDRWVKVRPYADAIHALLAEGV